MSCDVVNMTKRPRGGNCWCWKMKKAFCLRWWRRRLQNVWATRDVWAYKLHPAATEPSESGDPGARAQQWLRNQVSHPGSSVLHLHCRRLLHALLSIYLSNRNSFTRPTILPFVSLFVFLCAGTTCRSVRSSEPSWRGGEVHARTPASAAGSPSQRPPTSETTDSSDGSVVNIRTDEELLLLLSFVWSLWSSGLRWTEKWRTSDSSSEELKSTPDFSRNSSLEMNPVKTKQRQSSTHFWGRYSLTESIM